LRAVLKRALASRKTGQRVQVEVRNMSELDEALADGAEAILLDNMTSQQVKQSIERIREQTQTQAGRWIPTEASGRITLENIRSYAESGVDFISVGALTHSAKAADLSMTITAE
jgi:nicotinate-nucleotide pyrophosphorylase (carboxylating)